jgi:hypothetical protein
MLNRQMSALRIMLSPRKSKNERTTSINLKTMQIATSLQQPSLGLIKLDTLFPRWPGDLGLASSWGPSVQEVVVAGALPHLIVKQQQSFDSSPFAPAFGAAVLQLLQSGASAITTSCGFLVLWQQALQALSPVPVVTSSLCLLPALLQQEQRVGVLTIDAQSLTPMHWQGAGLSGDKVGELVVGGLAPDSHFCQSILGNQAFLDPVRAEQEVVAAALRILESAPHLKTLVLECTNLPPYQSGIEKATGLKVLSLRDVPLLKAAANAQA